MSEAAPIVVAEPVSAVAVPDLVPIDIARLKARHESIQQCMREVMQRGIDFDTLPGTKKPVLLKAGAETLCALFGLTPRLVSQEFGDGEAYTVVSICEMSCGGRVLGALSGSCCFGEKRFTKAVFVNGQDTGERVPLGSLSEMKNQIRKMAEKRALVAAVLVVTGASRLFTQDVEVRRESAPTLTDKQKDLLAWPLPDIADDLRAAVTLSELDAIWDGDGNAKGLPGWVKKTLQELYTARKTTLSMHAAGLAADPPAPEPAPEPRREYDREVVAREMTAAWAEVCRVAGLWSAAAAVASEASRATELRRQLDLLLADCRARVLRYDDEGVKTLAYLTPRGRPVRDWHAALVTELRERAKRRELAALAPVV